MAARTPVRSLPALRWNTSGRFIPFCDDFEGVDKSLAERLLADATEVDLSHVGRVPVSPRFVFRVRGTVGPEKYGIVPDADLLEQDDLRILCRVLRASQVDDSPEG